MPRAGQLCKPAFELSGPRAAREPSACERFGDCSDLFRPDRGRLEGEEGFTFGGSRGHAAGSLASEKQAGPGRKEPAYWAIRGRLRTTACAALQPPGTGERGCASRLDESFCIG